jgi:hypothetical protein
MSLPKIRNSYFGGLKRNSTNGGGGPFGSRMSPSCETSRCGLSATPCKLRYWRKGAFLPYTPSAWPRFGGAFFVAARFTEEHMVAIIREADREPVSVVAKRHGISEQTIDTWRKRFGGFQASDEQPVKYSVSGQFELGR